MTKRLFLLFESLINFWPQQSHAVWLESRVCCWFWRDCTHQQSEFWWDRADAGWESMWRHLIRTMESEAARWWFLRGILTWYSCDHVFIFKIREEAELPSHFLGRHVGWRDCCWGGCCWWWLRLHGWRWHFTRLLVYWLLLFLLLSLKFKFILRIFWIFTHNLHGSRKVIGKL